MAVDLVSTVTLLHFNGADASTTFTDESGKVWTAAGNAQIDTAQSVFGGASGLFDGSGDYISTPQHADHDFGSGDFTIGGRLRTATIAGGERTLYYQGTNGYTPILIEFNGSALQLYMSSNGSSWDIASAKSFGNLSAETWYHFELDRSGNNFYLFLGGALIDTFSSAATLLTPPSTLQIGGSSGQEQYYNGWIDELYINKGLARHTEAFTPHTEELRGAESYDLSIAEEFGISEVLGEKHDDVMEDGFSFSDVLGEKHDDVMEESIDLADSQGIGFLKDIDEGLSVEDLHTVLWPKEIAETVDLADLSRVALVIQILDGLFIYDDTAPGWIVTVPDTLDISDAISNRLTLLISEWIAFTDSQVNNWDGVEVVPEALNLYDLAKDIQRFAKDIDESLVLTDLAKYIITVTVLDLLGFTELATAVKSLSGAVSESLTLSDDSTRGFEKIIEEALSAVDVTTVITSFFNTISESLTATDAATLTSLLGATITDRLVVTDTVTSKGTLYSILYETLRMNVTVEIDGEIWECYVLNTPKFHPSMYSGFDFNSYCVFEGRAFGANDTGIFELTGTTDAGATIHTGAILNETDFGMPNQKRFRRGYLGISGASPVMVFETEDGHRQAYAIDSQGKVVASADLKSKNWILSIADFDELSTIKLIPVILTK
ncbi:MAG: LamG domain-containing protein [Desulfosalsimonadaceae bacterium]